jgi:hypothetical protein
MLFMCGPGRMDKLDTYSTVLAGDVGPHARDKKHRAMHEGILPSGQDDALGPQHLAWPPPSPRLDLSRWFVRLVGWSVITIVCI